MPPQMLFIFVFPLLSTLCYVGDFWMRFLRVLAVFAIFLSSSLSHAFNTNYSHHMCKIDTSTFYSQQYSFGTASITNYSTTKELKVTCPIVRRRHANMSVEIKVIDTNPTVDFRCTLLASRMNGTGSAGRVGYSSGALSTHQDISIGTSSLYTASPWPDMFLSCTIPRRSGSNYSRFLHYITEDF